MKIVAPQGTIDILPEETRMDRLTERVFMEKCRVFGYSEIHTPVFEYSSLFKKGVGHVTDIIEKELYTFTDKNGERFALRPEGTTGVARAVLEHELYRTLPARFCYRITCYRHENPEEGRLREFHQIGAECYGSAEPEADCEVISLAYSALADMGIGPLELNINSVGCTQCRVSYINALTRYLLPFANGGRLCPTCSGRLGKNPMRIMDCKRKECKEIAENAPKPIDYLCPDCVEHYEKVKRLLAAEEIPFNEKPKLIRGLDYYNRTVFEIKAGNGGKNGTVCGGGRYDELCLRIGGDVRIPAVGFAIGQERAVIAMGEGEAKKAAPEKPAAYIVSTDSAASSAAALRLRKAGIYAEADIMGRNRAEQLAAARKSGAQWLLYPSEKEIVLIREGTGGQLSFGANEWDCAAEAIKKQAADKI